MKFYKKRKFGHIEVTSFVLIAAYFFLRHVLFCCVSCLSCVSNWKQTREATHCFKACFLLTVCHPLYPHPSHQNTAKPHPTVCPLATSLQPFVKIALYGDVALTIVTTELFSDGALTIVRIPLFKGGCDGGRYVVCALF
jgi:hypothetical protein